jgi:5-methylcytosine-specific restriction endonuclease McrA
MTRSLGRTGHRWRVMVAIVKSEESVCWICGQQIHLSLPARHPMSYTVDHVIPLHIAPDLALQRGNLRAAHLRCNVIRSNKTRTKGVDSTTPKTSRKW